MLRKQERAALFALMLTLSPISTARAEEAKTGSDLSHYLEQLQVKLEHAAERANQPTASGGSSVVGLRGSKQEPLSRQLYWKGKKIAAPLTPDEVKLMRQAVEQARAGHPAEAVSILQAFEQKYPQSALLPDAQATLQRLNPPTAPADAAIPPPPAH